MGLDAKVREDLIETVEASLSSLFQFLDSSQTKNLIHIITTVVPEFQIQEKILSILPIYPPTAAAIRQSLARQFLGIPSTASPSDLLSYLQDSYPFTEIKRDISNEHTRAIKYAILIFDIAISHPSLADKETTRKIIQRLRSMHQRLRDERAAFLMRTETKEVIQRLWMRLDQNIHSTRRETTARLDEIIYK